ncbi:MAG: flavin reductase family protein [Gemmatimonadetes bacterium]|nr:flavin reductase family protein [Gemmatimonadota bacterium]
MDGFDFRQLCGRFATGIAVVTARDAEGRPAGMTVNSFTSVSLEPPLVLLAIDRAASMHEVLLGATHYTINILEAHQESLSRRFASGNPDRFEGSASRPMHSAASCLTARWRTSAATASTPSRRATTR